MKNLSLLSLSCAGGLWLSSCVYYVPTVPDMPYVAPKRSAAPIVDTWSTRPAAAPAAKSPAAPAAPGAKSAAPEAKSAVPKKADAKQAGPKNADAKKPLDLTKPSLPAKKAEPKPVAKPEPEPEKGVEKSVEKSVEKPAAPKLQETEAPLPEPKPELKAEPKPEPKTATKPEPKQDLKSITNTGAIPYATPVEGDPTRVYNPLDPSRKIRIIDKSGNRYPSGKELKVKGTNFHFYVP